MNPRANASWRVSLPLVCPVHQQVRVLTLRPQPVKQLAPLRRIVGLSRREGEGLELTRFGGHPKIK